MSLIDNNPANISFVYSGSDYILRFYSREYFISSSQLRSGNIKFIKNKFSNVKKNSTKIIGSIDDIFEIVIICYFNKPEIEYFIEIRCNEHSYIKNY